MIFFVKRVKFTHNLLLFEAIEKKCSEEDEFQFRLALYLRMKSRVKRSLEEAKKEVKKSSK